MVLQWRWDDGPPWILGLNASLSEDRHTLLVTGALVREDERRPLDDAIWLVAGGLVVWPQRVSRLQDQGAYAWITLLARHRPVPVADFDRFLEETTRTTAPIPLGLPEGFTVTRRTSVPKPRLHVRAPTMNEYTRDQDQKRGLSASIIPSDDGLVKLTEATSTFCFGDQWMAGLSLV